MEYDRRRIKEMARAIVHEAQPRPWKVFLLYYLIIVAISVITTLAITLPLLLSNSSTAPVSFPWAPFLLQLLLTLFNALMQIGSKAYCLKLWRKEPGGLRDLFQGFRILGKALALLGLEVLFTFLWTLLGLAVYVLLFGLISILPYDPVIASVFSLTCYIGFMIYLLNRIFRYSMAFYLLLDHPYWTARQALRASKILMAERKWDYFVLQLSFLGWSLLVLVIFYTVMAIPMIMDGSSLLLLRDPAAYMYPNLLLAFLVSAPLSLWLQAYWGSSIAGFYDWAAYQSQPSASDVRPSPTSSWNAPRSTEPWDSSRDSGTFDGEDK